MIRFFPDINCLLAIAWPNHQFHQAALDWFLESGKHSWCTHAISELGFVRISSNPAFSSQAKTPTEAIALLQRLCEFGNHSQLKDSPSPCSLSLFSSLSLQGHRQVTDAYLLELARQNNVSLTSFDRGLYAYQDYRQHLTLLET